MSVLQRVGLLLAGFLAGYMLSKLLIVASTIFVQPAYIKILPPAIPLFRYNTTRSIL